MPTLTCPNKVDATTIATAKTAQPIVVILSTPPDLT
jgi:hypothetical protein